MERTPKSRFVSVGRRFALAGLATACVGLGVAYPGWHDEIEAVGYYAYFEGETEGGVPVAFMVEDGAIVQASIVGMVLDCEPPFTLDLDYSATGQLGPIVDGEFVVELNVSDSRPLPGVTMAFDFEGTVDTVGQASGRLIAGRPAYTGLGVETQSCEYTDAWRAREVPALSEGTRVKRRHSMVVYEPDSGLRHVVREVSGQTKSAEPPSDE